MTEQAIESSEANDNVLKLFVGGTQRLTNELICYYLESKTGFACSGGTVADLLKMLQGPEKEKLKAVLLDYESAEVRENLGEGFREFSGKLEGMPTIIFNYNAETRIKRWIAHGIRGLLYKSDPCQNLVKAVKAVTEGHIWIPKQAMSLCINELTERSALCDQGLECLTRREREILGILALGTTNAEVAEKLFISPYTVKVHVQNIFKKIGVPNRVKAAIWAQQNLHLPV